MAAFEALYDRHIRELLSFCIYMLGSRQDAEDAVQATFTSAYRALRADERPVALRAWLFTIARNDCLSILRRRRPVVELNGEVAPGPDPVTQIELREEVRHIFAALRELPESQRAALVLAEFNGLSQQEIGDVLGVRADQVKAFVYQARSNLLSERRARDTDCHEIREELASARGASLLRGRLRRHVRSCADCRVYADGMARQRRQLGALLPIVPSLALKYRALESTIGLSSSEQAVVAGGATVGASVAGTAADLAGGGIKVLVCKVAAGVVCLGAGAGVGVSVLETPETTQGNKTSSEVAASTLPRSEGGAPSVAAGTAGAAGALPGGRGTTNATAGPERPLGADGMPVVQNVSHSYPGAAGGKSGPQDGSIGRPGNVVRTPGSGSSPGSGRGSSGTTGQLRREVRQRIKGEHQATREAHKPASVPPSPPTEAEIAEKHEKHRLAREGREPGGHSRAPHTEAELAEKRERQQLRREERRKAKEQREREAAGAAPAP
jgi:RNA polymerase sigma factor (sigma-70 family)